MTISNTVTVDPLSSVPVDNPTAEMLRSLCVDNETASLAAAELVGLEVQEMEGVTMYSGWHKEYGNIHIVIPAFGNGVIALPVAIRAF